MGRGLEEISKVFLSTSKETEAKKMPNGSSFRDLNIAESFHQPEGKSEIEETVTVRRRIAYQDDTEVEENMRRALSDHLEKGFKIKRIDLKNNTNISEPKRRLRRDEEVTIFVKAPSPP